MKSYYARLLAVRKVTQDNQGKKTAGVDGVIAVSPEQRLNLTEEIKGTLKAKPLRRVWIPKPGRDEKRPVKTRILNRLNLSVLAEKLLSYK